MNIRTSQREQVLAAVCGHVGSSPMTVVPVTFFPSGRQAVSAPRSAFRVGNQTGFLGYNRLSIPAKATRRDDGLEFSEVEIGDGLEGFGRGCVAEAVGQGIKPGDELGLQSEQLGDGVVPSLWPGASVGRPAIANPEDRCRVIVFVARAVARLTFSVAEGGLTFGLAASWHGMSSVTVTQIKGWTRLTCRREWATFHPQRHGWRCQTR
jgi:hypothetical protein